MIEVRVAYWHEDRGLVREPCESERRARRRLRELSVDPAASDIRVEWREVSAWERLNAALPAPRISRCAICGSPAAFVVKGISYCRDDVERAAGWSARAELPHSSEHLDVTFYANLRCAPPTGHVLLGRDVLTLEEARELAGRLEHACARLDVLIAANTPEARAA